MIDEYRAYTSQKRGGFIPKVTIDRMSSLLIGDTDIDLNLIEFDKLLTKLSSIDERAAQIVELKFFAGLTNEETSEICSVTTGSVISDWKFAKSWLLAQLT